MAEMPNALTPENIAAVAQNAEQIISLLRGKDQVQVQQVAACGSNQVSGSCCCPRKIKFFIFGNTWINNYNAQCPNFPA